MKHSWTRFGTLLHTIGGVVLYALSLWIGGIKPAIVITLMFVLCDGGFCLYTKRRISPLWLVSNGAALLFGLIDLYACTPFMIRYEGTLFNLGWAALFLLGATGKNPPCLIFARRYSPDIPDRPELVRFFRAFSLIWSLYFITRAFMLLWIMNHFPLTQAFIIRIGFSWISIGIMIVFSLNGRRIFQLCKRFGLFTAEQK